MTPDNGDEGVVATRELWLSSWSSVYIGARRFSSSCSRVHEKKGNEKVGMTDVERLCNRKGTRLINLTVIGWRKKKKKIKIIETTIESSIIDWFENLILERKRLLLEQDETDLSSYVTISSFQFLILHFHSSACWYNKKERKFIVLFYRIVRI